MTSFDPNGAGTAAETPFRPRPRVTERTEAFWTGGRDGALRIARCDACGYYVHPPGPVCPECTGRAISYAAVSGRATVIARTVNHQPWYPGWATPYVVAIVELAEQPGLRLTTNIVGCDPQDVHIGMAVRVQFLERDGVWLPLFVPDLTAPAASP